MNAEQAQQEAEANQFAMCLLMPMHLVHVEADKLVTSGRFDEDGVKALAKTFGVSEVLMTIRLQQLGRITFPLPGLPKHPGSL